MKAYCEISTPDVLMKKLQDYRTILSDRTLDYFQSLIIFESSIVDKSVSMEEMEILSCLPIYKDIAKCNIYNRAISLLESKGINLSKNSDYRNKRIRITASQRLSNSPRTIDVLDLSIYEDDSIELQLFNSLNDDRAKEREIQRLKNKISKINQNQENIARHMSLWPCYDLYRYNFSSDGTDCLLMYKKIVKKMNSRVELSKNDQEEITRANEIYSLLMNGYGLNENEFESNDTEYITGVTHKYMKKIKSKTFPGVKVTINNYYL